MAPARPPCAHPVPARAGIGLRPAHFERVLAQRPPLPFLELHSENFFGAGGPLLRLLDAVRRDYPLSLHGVGLSLGSADRLDAAHLAALKALVDRAEPSLVSEHVCWGAIGGRHFNDLLPLPWTEEALALMAGRVGRVQDALGRPILVENVSSYLRFRHSTMDEWDFLAELARRSGCGLLLDVSNIYVNSVNHGFDPYAYVDAIPPDAVVEMHLAGFTRKDGPGGPLLIDSHDAPVDEAVWALYAHAVARIGPRPTLIEWDRDLPAFAVLQAEARRADACIDAAVAETAA